MPRSPTRARSDGFRRFVRSGLLRLAMMGRTYPVDPGFGRGHGTPVDRYYIERFLAKNAASVTGRVLEVGDAEYTERFGSGVTTSDILNFTQGAPGATIVADLSNCPQIPSGSFDSIILTQTLHYIYDMEAAVAELHRILAPAGRLLCTVPGISQVSRFDMEHWGDRWRLTSLSARELFATSFDAEDVCVTTWGNALSSVFFLEGIVAERLRPRELDAREEDYELLVTVVATKAR